MKRDIDRLESETFDAVIVGGGIHGACAAMEAAQRGLRVGMVEKSDFGAATSHNSLKIVHGGIRYLQHLDFRRVRQSIVERKFWLRCAPHMVVPLQFRMPLKGLGTHGAAALRSAMSVHELIGFDRNRGVLPERTIPGGEIHGRARVRAELGDLWGDDHRGAAAWWDGQMLDSDRLLLECVLAAHENGAAVANYVEVLGLERCRSGKGVAGVIARDKLSGREFLLRAGRVILATGPWTEHVAKDRFHESGNLPHGRLMCNMNVVLDFDIGPAAIALRSAIKSDAVVGESERLYFLVPWRGLTIAGTTHTTFDGNPVDWCIGDSAVADFLAELNRSSTALSLSDSDVKYIHAGLTPAEGVNDHSARSRSSRVIDHGASGGTAGIYSITGVKYTTARLLAEQVVDRVARSTKDVARSRSLYTPLPGALNYQSREELLREIMSHGVADESGALDLAIAYGTRYTNVVAGSEDMLDTDSILAARVRFAVRHEMACSIDDIVIRRMDLASRGLLDSDLERKITEVYEREKNQDARSDVGPIHPALVGRS